MEIIKASGEREAFRPRKVYRTCRRAGADKNLAETVVKKVEKQIYSGISSQKILALILKNLAKQDPASAARYSLKKAILDLGPSGFVFEKFIVRLLQSYGYQAYCPPILSGACVEHEVDVIAKTFNPPEWLELISKNRKTKHQIKKRKLRQEISYMIECKYHNLPGLRSGLKEALYVWARFMDLNDSVASREQDRFNFAWIVSNTKFSISSIKYSRCRQIRLLGWKYPVNHGLERLIEQRRLYPITILRNLKREERNKLFTNDYLLCQDLLEKPINQIVKITGLNKSKLERLARDAQRILKS